MESARKFPEVPRSTEEHDILRGAIAQGQTEKNHTARRIDALERADKAKADDIQVLKLIDAEARLARLEEIASRFTAYEQVG